MGRGKGTGSGEPQIQYLIGKEEKYHVGEQLSSLKVSIKPSPRGAGEGTVARQSIT